MPQPQKPTDTKNLETLCFNLSSDDQSGMSGAVAHIPLGRLRFPLSNLPRQFLLLHSLPRFVSSPSSLYGLILFKGNSFETILSEGFKGSSRAPKLPAFNWKPTSLSCLPPHILFFLLGHLLPLGLFICSLCSPSCSCMHLSSLRAETLFCALGVLCQKQSRHEL